MSEKLKAAVREFYERGWNQGDLSVIDELFSSEYQDHDAAAQTDTSGLQAARRFIELFRAAIPDLHVAIEDQYAEGWTVTTRWTATGTHKGTVFGVPATHRRVEVSGISIDRFDEEGRFAEGWATGMGSRCSARSAHCQVLRRTRSWLPEMGRQPLRASEKPCMAESRRSQTLRKPNAAGRRPPPS
jgi:steroid delta-isomerase-like uncharacterized protein